MIDFKKVGEAAIAFASEHGMSMYPSRGERMTDIGKAAVAAMIPPAKTEPLSSTGLSCSDSCPFLSNGDWGYFCYNKWLKADGDIWPPVPSPQYCPAHKEAKND